MARTVFDNAMVAHVWSAMKQPYGRSANGNLSFDGPTLYSYDTPIARIVRDVNGGLCALHFEGKYSPSTGKHQSEAHAAARHMRLFNVHYVTARSEGWAPSLPSGCTSWANPGMMDDELIHRANLAWYARKFEEEISQLMDLTPAMVDRAGGDGSKPWAGSEAATRLVQSARFTEMHRYADAFGLVPRGYNLWEIGAMIAQSYAHKQELWNDPKKAAKRAKARAASEAKRAAQEALREAARREEALSQMRSIAENLEAWRNGAPVPTYRLKGIGSVGYALRVKGDTLETSGGASVPLAHAIRVLRAVEACRAKGEGWKRNGHTLHVGHFQVDEIMPNGDFKAGCHFIQWQEVERVAGALGLLGGGGKEEAA